MSSFQIDGGYKLKGTLVPQGAKNEALQVICAALLTGDEVVIDNIPDIIDVKNLILLLQNLGVEVKQPSSTSYSFKAHTIDLEYLLSEDYSKKSVSLRGSVMIIGPLLLIWEPNLFTTKKMTIIPSRPKNFVEPICCWRKPR